MPNQEQYKNESQQPEPVASSSCDLNLSDDEGRKAVAVDPETKASNIRRLRRVEGQVRGLQKMVEEDRYCPDIMIQLSAVQEALRMVGRTLLRNHLKHCTTHAVLHDTPEQKEAVYDELLDLIYKHSR
jgi:CsoR family transcriptional regulator, copper-sensing transcriptional repressor